MCIKISLSKKIRLDYYFCIGKRMVFFAVWAPRVFAEFAAVFEYKNKKMKKHG